MSAISVVNTAETIGDQSNSRENNVLGKDDFLNLLVTQLQNQDPLNPMDSTTFTSQLAEFSSLEQLEGINGNLENLNLSQESINRSQAVSLIGRDVMASGNSIQVNQGVADTLHFILEKDAAMVNGNIYDSAGGFVTTIQTGPLTAGEQTLNWDGTDLNGNQIQDGAYSFEVLAADVNSGQVDVKTISEGRVTAVSYENGSTYLSLGDQKIPLKDVYQVIENKE